MSELFTSGSVGGMGGNPRPYGKGCRSGRVSVKETVLHRSRKRYPHGHLGRAKRAGSPVLCAVPAWGCGGAASPGQRGRCYSHATAFQTATSSYYVPYAIIAPTCLHAETQYSKGEAPLCPRQYGCRSRSGYRLRQIWLTWHCSLSCFHLDRFRWPLFSICRLP